MKKIIVSLLVGLLLIPSVVCAENIKDRIKNRAQKLMELKEGGVVVENDNGFVDYGGSDPSIIDFVRAENDDRQTVYRVIAKKTKLSAERVGQRRALQIKKRSLVENDANKAIALVPEGIGTTIISNCKKKWPENFRMQRYCINEEAKAWLDVN